MTIIKFNKFRIFSVILIILNNWNEIVLSTYHNNNNHNFNNTQISANRLRHHNNHHHNHHQRIQHQQQQFNYHQQHENNHQNHGQQNLYNRNRELDDRKSHLNHHRQNSWTSKHNKIDEALQTFRSSSTTTTNRPFNYNRNQNNNWHNYRRGVELKKYHPTIQRIDEINDRHVVHITNITDYYHPKRLTMLKVNDSDLQQSWLKPDLHKNSSIIQNNFRTTTFSPFHRKITTISSRFYEISAPRKSTSKIKNDNNNNRGVHRNNDDDYYYYYDDDDDADDDNEEVELNDDDDEDENINNFDITYQKRNNRGTNHKFLDRFADDYQFDEPINRINSNKTETLTEQKWRELGTAEAVEISRRKSLNETQLVSAHITRVHLEAMCKYPRPKIIQINEASKRYVPHCTVLYRCGDDTGCCHSDTHKCVAKKTTTIDLYFYAIPLGMKDPVVETLSFINHTECHCVEKYKSSKLTRNHMLLSTVIGNHLSDEEDENNNSTVKKVTSNYCRCTRHFDIFEEESDDITDYQNDEPIIESRKKCRCDCLTSNAVCQRLKKGLEGFFADDQKCITNERCTTPSCGFGDYSTATGRCPRSKEKRTINRTNYHFN